MTKITVSVKNVYGNRTIYPACPVSEKLADLIGTKTFTDRAVNQIKGLGYVFIVKHETI
jgi:hypothetical protein